MAQQTLNNGESGLLFRTKLNDNFTDLYTNKVDVVAGKGLSTEDFTSAEKSDLAANTSARHTHANKATLDAITASYTTAEETKLSLIEDGATANSTDAFLLARANHTGTQTSDTIIGPNSIGSPTHLANLTELIDHIYSATITDGGELTEPGIPDGTVNIAAGELMIRAIDSGHSSLYNSTFDAVAGLVLTDNTTNYVYVDYNAGTPIIAVTLDPTIINLTTKVPMYVITREGTVLNNIPVGDDGVDFMGKTRKRWFFTERFQRVGEGSVVSESGTRNLACTAGGVYFGNNEIDIPVIDTSITGSFEYYRLITGTWVESDETQLSNTQYNNIATPGSESLDAIPSNDFVAHHIYAIINSPSQYAIVYGQAAYNTFAGADASPTPSTLPPSIQGLGYLLGRYIIQEGAATGVMQSAFTTTFSAATATTHNGLSGLQGGTIGEYYHLNSAQHINLTGFSDIISLPSVDGTLGQTLVTDGAGTATWQTGSATDQFAKVSAADTTAGYLGTKIVAGANITLTILNPGANETYEIATGAAVGEANTASNVGVAGIGMFKQKTGVDLEFKNLNIGSNKLSITDDVANNEVDIDVVEANLTLSNIGGSVTDAQVPNTITLDNITQITNRSHTGLTDIGTNSHTQIDAHIADIANPHEVTQTQVGLSNVDNTSDATKFSAAGSLTNKTIALANNTITGSTSDFNTALTDGSFATIAGIETLTSKTLTDAKLTYTVNTQTGLTYTFVLTDQTKVIEMNNASANVITIPTNASVALPIGTTITVVQYGAGLTTVTGDTGVTVNGASAGSKATAAQYEGLALYKRATDEWIVINK